MRRFFSISSRHLQQQQKSSTLIYSSYNGKQTDRTRLTNFLWKDRFATTAQNTKDEHKTKPIQLDFSKPKTIHDSYVEVILPFEKDLELREEYINYFKGLRLGKLLEDLDALAATIAYKHCLPKSFSIQDIFTSSNLPYYIVTASMDRMDLLSTLEPEYDLKMYGNVDYAGNRSMEVTVGMESKKNDQWTPICICKFTLVAKSIDNNPDFRVPPLKALNAEEEKLIQLGRESKARKLAFAESDLFKEPPTTEERLLIHQLWLNKSENDPKTTITMSQTKQNSLRICHPQERNIHNAIFGGFLMREAYELAYASAILFLEHSRPYTISLDQIQFKKPVPIGSILVLDSEVVYAEGKGHGTFQIGVLAKLYDSETKSTDISNVFYFTFGLPKSSTHEVKKVIPMTYEESLKYVLGKRRKERGILENKRQMKELELWKRVLKG